MVMTSAKQSTSLQVKPLTVNLGCRILRPPEIIDSYKQSLVTLLELSDAFEDDEAFREKDGNSKCAKMTLDIEVNSLNRSVQTANGALYRFEVRLLDINRPARLLIKSKEETDIQPSFKYTFCDLVLKVQNGIVIVKSTK